MTTNKLVLWIVLFFLSVCIKSQTVPGCQNLKQQINQPPIYYSAENKRSDTFNVFKYFVNLEIGNTANKFIRGNTQIKLAPKMNNRTFVLFDLLKMQIDSVKESGNLLTYQYNDTILKINFLW